MYCSSVVPYCTLSVEAITSWTSYLASPEEGKIPFVVIGSGGEARRQLKRWLRVGEHNNEEAHYHALAKAEAMTLWHGFSCIAPGGSPKARLDSYKQVRKYGESSGRTYYEIPLHKKKVMS